MILAQSSITLIKCLSDGDFHSGKELGELLKVSRAAVWKRLQKLSDFGIEVQSLKGKGYRIVGGIDLLDNKIIISNLDEKPAREIDSLDILYETASTNSFLIEALNQKNYVKS